MDTRFSDWLSSEMKKRRFSQNALAKEAGVTQSVISSIIKGTYKPSADFCIKIAPVLEADPATLLRLAGILPPLPDDDSPLATEGSELLRAMPDEKRRQAVRYLRFLYQDSDDD